MPEIKHTFSGGKMNKDLDERLVPNGEYRHAMNIQVRTTSGDSDGVGDAGVVQNIQGNKKFVKLEDINKDSKIYNKLSISQKTITNILNDYKKYSQNDFQVLGLTYFFDQLIQLI